MILKRIYRKIYNVYYHRKFAEVGNTVTFSSIKFLVGAKHISIGDNTCFGYDLYLTAWEINGKKPKIKIGNNCSFGSWNHLSASNSIIIGDGLLTGKWVTIVDNSHGDTSMGNMMMRPWLRPILSKGAINIGNNVWIGDKATILPGVTIGDGCIIGANAVVTRDVPPYSVIAGNPAKVIRQIKIE